MKNLFFVRRSYAFFKTKTVSILLVFTLFTCSLQAQVYYSNFSSPSTGDYSSVIPSGGTLCLAIPGVTSNSNVADVSLTNFSQIFSALSLGISCNQSQYIVSAKLNFASAPGVTFAPAGYNAGFRLRLSTLLNVNLLGSGLKLNTYLNGNLQEFAVGAGLVGLDLLSASSDPQYIYFTTTKNFDQVEIVLNSSVVAVGVGIDYRFYYAFASSAVILPVKLTSFTANTAGKNVRLQWTTATEVNTAKYEVESSNDGGRTFSTIGSVAAKGNSANTTDYSFTDGAIVNGDYLYRLKMIDKDGAFDYSKLVSVKGLSSATWKVYPTMLSSGTSITVDIANNNSIKTEVRLSNMQGQTIRTLNANSSRLLISTDHLPAGIYSVKLFQNGQLTGTEKVVMQ